MRLVRSSADTFCISRSVARMSIARDALSAAGLGEARDAKEDEGVALLGMTEGESVSRTYWAG